MNDTVEIWSVIPGFEKYQVSNLGNVRGPRSLLKPEIMRNGYLRVNIYDTNSKMYARLVHILVATVFIGDKPSEKHQVAHKDGNKQNNNSANLRWATAKENAQDWIEQGINPEGENNGNCKLSDSKVADIRRKHKEGRTVVSLAAEYGIQDYWCSKIVNNRVRV